MSNTITTKYVGNIDGYLLEELREVHSELEVISRSPHLFSVAEQKDHAQRRTLVSGKILEHFREAGGMEAVGLNAKSDNGAIFLNFSEET